MSPELRRSIGLIQATAMVAGTIIGASIFVQPSVVTSHVSSLAAAYAAWAAAGALTMIVPICVPLWGVVWAVGYVASGYISLGIILATAALPPLLGFVAGWPFALVLKRVSRRSGNNRIGVLSESWLMASRGSLKAIN